MVIQEIGILKETTEGSDAISGVSIPYYELGSYAQSFGNFPLPKNTAFAKYAGSSKSISSIDYTKQESIVNSVFVPSDFSAAAAVLGSTTWDATKNTITASDTVDTYTIRMEIGEGTSILYKSLLAAKFGQASYTLTRGGYLGGTITGLGKNIAASTVQEHHAPVFRTGNEDMFMHNSSSVITFGGENIAPYFLDSTVMMGIPLKPITTRKSGVRYPDYIDLGDRFYGASFTVLRDDYYTVITDLISQNTQTLVMKVYNHAGKYVQFTASNCAVLTADANHALPSDTPKITVQLLPTSVSVEDNLGDIY